MSISLLFSRPKDKRSDIEEQVYDVLQELNIPYQRVDHSPAATINECIEIEQILDVHICKNIFLTNKKKDIYCLLLLKNNKKYDASKVSKQIGSSRLSFANDTELMHYLGTSPGSVSVLSIINDDKNDVIVAIDSDLLKNEFIGCHPCKNTSTLKIKTTDITEKFIPLSNHKFVIINV